nr:low specificity L-threonine aldolase [Clostridia bacterium]
MISFENDYNTGAHPKVLEHLMRTNLEPETGYGFDRYCESARRKIRTECGIEDADVEFLTGGTQTNMTVISTMLGEHEGVVAARSGHVATPEAGAIEFTGHEVLELDESDGKLD